MEKFNLERALAGEPVCTRSGKDVTQLTKFDTHENYPIVGVVDGCVKCWTIDGEYFDYSAKKPHDLFMKSKENAIWANVLKNRDGNLSLLLCHYHSEEVAKKAGAKYEDYLKTVKIDDKL